MSDLDDVIVDLAWSIADPTEPVLLNLAKAELTRFAAAIKKDLIETIKSDAFVEEYGGAVLGNYAKSIRFRE